MAKSSVERVGEAFEFAEQLTIVGARLTPGDRAPDFELDYLDPADGAIKQIGLSDTTGSVRLLHIVNSLDTPVCHVGAQRWDDLRNDLPASVRVYTISMDLPFAQARWQSAEGTHHQNLSTHRSERFGIDYGVLLKEWRLLQRAVFVIDANDTVVYAEYVADQMQEPNYDAAVAAVRQTVTTT